MGKKNPFVFTIGFDKSDPDHVYVTELLNTTEKKAKLIVAAILAYTGRTDGGALIDYVLLLDNKKASKVKVGQSYIVRSLSIDGKKVDTSAVSDHYPVFVDVKL